MGHPPSSGNGKVKEVTEHKSIAPKVKVRSKGNERTIKFPTGSDSSNVSHSFGTNDTSAIDSILRQPIRSHPDQIHSANVEQSEKAINEILGLLHGIGPKDTLEGMIAAQMLGVHNLAMEFLKRSTSPDQGSDHLELNINRVAKLLRLFNSQVDTLNRYRNRGQQQVNVQHIQVNGGQAQVGQFGATGGGVNRKKRR